MNTVQVNTIQSNGLSNIQYEILKLYATGLVENELLELKRQLACFYAKKVVQEADNCWDEKSYTAEDMDKWLDE